MLDNILIPRVVGTPGHAKVFEFITKKLKSHHWHVDVDQFEDATPNMGKLTFKNIIATLNPDAEKYLVLACHYDSKYFPNGEFLGATDSAVPCAMMLNLIHVMRKELRAIREREDLSLMLVFFDGEEAFLEWGPNDSIYGAKHLAKMMENTTGSVKGVSNLRRLEMMVLLDLIGAKNPSFYSYFKDTENAYLQLVKAESRLANFGLLKKYNANRQKYFVPQARPSFIEDDHVPFLQRGNYLFCEWVLGHFCKNFE